MPWTADPRGGFTTGEPWLPLGEENLARSVAVQRAEPGSMLMLHRRLIELRRREAALSIGSYRPVAATGDLLAYRRAAGGRELLVALNLGAGSQRLVVPDDLGEVRVVLSATGAAEGRNHRDEIELAANEALVLEPRQQG
jgi:alpha-glucosidase